MCVCGSGLSGGKIMLLACECNLLVDGKKGYMGGGAEIKCIGHRGRGPQGSGVAGKRGHVCSKPAEFGGWEREHIIPVKMGSD